MNKDLNTFAAIELQVPGESRGTATITTECAVPPMPAANPVAADDAITDLDAATKKRIKVLKTVLTRALNRGLLPESTKEKMREAARRAPHLFGKWRSI